MIGLSADIRNKTGIKDGYPGVVWIISAEL